MHGLLVAQAAAGLLILLLHAALAAGCLRETRRDRRAHAAPRAGALPVLPEVELIVALRDEEACLPALLSALEAQDDPAFRCLFVDDRSRDRTGEILDRWCAAPGRRARVLHVTEEPRGLTGKQAALDAAFAQARGGVLLFTDGDCVPPPGWVRAMRAHFADPRVGIVLGRIELPRGGTLLERFQAFEQPLLNQYNLGSAAIGVPTGCFGNNMAVRAEALRPTGGFHSMGWSVTEDALLLDTIRRTGDWTTRACLSADAAVVTRPQRSWRAFIAQHTRWNAGALFSRDLVTRLLYLAVVLVYLVGSMVLLPVGLLDARVSLLSLNAFLSIGLLAAVGGAYPGQDARVFWPRFLPFLLFFGFFYSGITVRALLRRPFDWKGSSLRP